MTYDSNTTIEWENLKIDLNDMRLINYIIYVDYNGLLNIMHKQTFNIIKFKYVKDKGSYIMYDSKNEVISIFMDISIILAQLWR